jgi:hypothetical protein
MKKRIRFLIALLLLPLLVTPCYAENVIRVSVPIARAAGVWLSAAPLYSTWANTASAAVCTTWTPDPTTIDAGNSFQQTSADCKQNQTRTLQPREQNTTTLEYRNAGVVQTLSQVATVTMTRVSTGTKPVWFAAAPLNSTWVNTADAAVCTTWTPDPSTISAGTSFQQTSTDCKQNQTSTSQPREQNATTLAYRDSGVAQTLSQVVTVTMTRSATGTSTQVSIVYMDAVSTTAPNNGSVHYAYSTRYGGAPLVNSTSYPLKYLVEPNGGYGSNLFFINIGLDISKIQSGKIEFLDSTGKSIFTSQPSAPGVYSTSFGQQYFYSCGAGCDAYANQAGFMRVTMVLK